MPEHIFQQQSEQSLDQPLISAIIIFLNEERFLREAIASVIAQTYKHWELLLIDDGSTDRSTQIARNFTRLYPEQIRYLTHENFANRGMSASRNLGVAEAKGKYIAYLDGDDVWVPHKLEAQMKIMAEQPEAAMVYGPLLDWHSWSNSDVPDGLYGVAKDGSHPYAEQLVKAPNLLRLFLEDEVFIPSGGLIERGAIAQFPYEDAFRGGYSDAVAFVKLCLSYPVWVSSECWYKYRQHPNSSTAISTLNGDDPLEALIYLTWVKDYLIEQGTTDARVWRAVNKALWPYRHPKLQQWRVRIQQVADWVEFKIVRMGRKLLPRALRHWLWTTVKGEPESKRGYPSL